MNDGFDEYRRPRCRCKRVKHEMVRRRSQTAARPPQAARRAKIRRLI